jgi:hypothetical protein
MKKYFLLISSILVSQVVFAAKEITHANGYKIEKFYKIKSSQCYLVTDAYKQTMNGVESKPLVEEPRDMNECHATFINQKEGCVAYDLMNSEMGKVKAENCAPGTLQKDGWYVVSKDIKGAWQVTMQKGPHLFTGGKEPEVEYSYQSEQNCKITLFDRTSGNRWVNARIIRLSDIQVKIDENVAYFSFNSFSEKTPSGQQLEVVKNVTCSMKQGTTLSNGQKFDINNADSFKPNSMQEITTTFLLPISKKPPTDI